MNNKLAGVLRRCGHRGWVTAAYGWLTPSTILAAPTDKWIWSEQPPAADTAAA
jgi:hypothetical protein